MSGRATQRAGSGLFGAILIGAFCGEVRATDPGAKLKLAPPGQLFAGDGLRLGATNQPDFVVPTPGDPPGGAPGANLNGVTVIPCVASPVPGGGGGPGRPVWGIIDSMVKVPSQWGACTVVSTGPTLVLVEMTNGTDYITTAQFTVDVEGGAPCGGGGGGCGAGAGSGAGGGGCQTCGGGGSGGLSPALLASALMRIPLGRAFDDLSAGFLRLDVETPSGSLADPTLLVYDQEDGYKYAPPVVVKRANGSLRQIKTPELLADIVTDQGGFHVSMYGDANVTYNQQDDLYDGAQGTDFRQWVFSAPNQGQLLVSEEVRDGTSFVVRAAYLYAYNSTTHQWTLTTSDGASTAARVETLSGWTYDTGQTHRTRTYVVKDGADHELNSHEEEQTQYQYYPDDSNAKVWRRTRQTVDPSGFHLETTWTYAEDTGEPEKHHGVVLKSVQYPDGSWSVFNIFRRDEDDDQNDIPAEDAQWVVQIITGLKDQEFISDPDPHGTTVQSTTRIYKRYWADGTFTARYLLMRQEAWVGGERVERVDFDHTIDPFGASHTNEDRWQNRAGTSTMLHTEYDWTYRDDSVITYVPRVTGITYPDGLQETHDYKTGGLSTTTPTYPDKPTFDENSGSGFNYHAVSRGEVPEKSTMRVTVTDQTGRSWLEETWVCTSASAGEDPAEWALIGWTTRTYDAQGRPVAEWYNDGRHDTILYSSCCAETRTDSEGVATAVTRDALGRVDTVVRSAAEQSTITTAYNYSTPLQETVTVSAGGLSQSTTRAFDKAGRLASVTTGTGDGAMKTLYKYEFVSTSGRKNTVWRNYPTSATSGTAGLRDEISEYYRDGSLKRVSGSSVVERRYDYDKVDDDILRTKSIVTTGPSDSERTETTYRDMLGRVKRIDRPGWAASGTETLTTENFYDDTTGRLLKVISPGQADTLYDYDELGSPWRTVLDVADTGTINLDGTDRISETETKIELDGGQYWQITRQWVYAAAAGGTPTLTGKTKTRLTGYTGASDEDAFTTRETISYDIHDHPTTTIVEIERDIAARTETTTTPDSSTDAVRTYIGGRLMSAVSSTGVTTAYHYDALGRRDIVTDGRGNTTQTCYDGSGRVSCTKDGDENETDYVYYTTSDTGTGVYPGRLKYVENPDTKKTRYAYSDRGETIHTWGDVPYPTENVYDDYGQRTALKTYRGSASWSGSTWPSSPGTADETTWEYHNPTGLLNDKQYADDTQLKYTYYGVGRLYTRQWARHSSSELTTYSYDDDTGELTAVDYATALNTTDLAYTYDRLGRRATVTDAAGTRTLAVRCKSPLTHAA